MFFYSFWIHEKHDTVHEDFSIGTDTWYLNTRSLPYKILEHEPINRLQVSTFQTHGNLNSFSDFRSFAKIPKNDMANNKTCVFLRVSESQKVNVLPAFRNQIILAVGIIVIMRIFWRPFESSGKNLRCLLSSECMPPITHSRILFSVAKHLSVHLHKSQEKAMTHQNWAPTDDVNMLKRHHFLILMPNNLLQNTAPRFVVA